MISVYHREPCHDVNETQLRDLCDTNNQFVARGKRVQSGCTFSAGSQACSFFFYIPKMISIRFALEYSEIFSAYCTE